jgi:hypothetical protein
MATVATGVSRTFFQENGFDFGFEDMEIESGLGLTGASGHGI